MPNDDLFPVATVQDKVEKYLTVYDEMGKMYQDLPRFFSSKPHAENKTNEEKNKAKQTPITNQYDRKRNQLGKETGDFLDERKEKEAEAYNRYNPKPRI